MQYSSAICVLPCAAAGDTFHKSLFEPALPLTEPNGATSPPGRWGIASLLAFGVMVSYFDRINLAISQQALHDNFGISLVAFGYLSSAFSWSYAATQIPAGVFLDRFGVRRVVAAGTLLWSVASFCTAVSTGVYGFFAARLLLGAAESPVFPANAKSIGEWFTPGERSLAMAVTDSAAKFSSAIGVPLLGLVLIHFGWRWNFAATGLISLIYFSLFRKFYRDAKEKAALASEASTGQHKQSTQTTRMLGYLLRQRKVYGLALGWCAYNYTFFLLLAWLPSYLSVSLHVDLLHSVLYTSLPWLFATVTDLFVGGWLVDFLLKRGYSANRVRHAVLIGGTGFGLAIWGAARAHSPAAAVLWISIALGGLAAAAPVAWTVPSLIAPRDGVGTLASIVNLSGQIAAIFAPVVTGYLVSATHSFAMAFAAATVILALGIAGYIFLLGAITPIPEPSR